MKHAIAIKGEVDGQRARELVEARIRRLARLTQRFPEDLVFLHAVVEAHPRQPLVRVSLALRLPSRTLAAQEEGKLAEETIREAFDELERLLKKEKERLRGEKRWGRVVERARERFVAAQARPIEELEEELRRFDALAVHLPDLQRYVRRELSLLEASGDLYPREIDPLDVVDAAIERAVLRLDKKPEKQDLRAWLLQQASKVIHAERDRVRAERRSAVHIEEDVPETPPEEEVSTLGDEILDFYQPDEDLRMEDVLPALDVPTPEKAEELAELERCLFDALSALPQSWRDAFVLRELEGLDEAAVADATGLDREAVKRHVESARAFLRERLTQAGLLP